MSKFDEEKLKIRRAFSLEDIDEEDSWVASGEEEEEEDDSFEEEDDEFKRPRRYSFPLNARQLAEVPDRNFKQTIREIQEATKEFLQDNVYADCKPLDRTKE